MADNNPVGMMLETPLPALIEMLGLSIANAQYALDRNAIAIAKLLAAADTGVRMPGEDRTRSMLEMGFAPTFYHLTEATIEARVAFSISESSEFKVGASAGMSVGFFAASVNASYSQKYSFEATASSAIRAKFVSVPPPPVFQELLRASVGRTDKP
ncbi:MAG: hypothetical protein JNL82_16990 [Myxococcales bacterium]|nr:hypothetical protein [Myxococcales bacterium]